MVRSKLFSGIGVGLVALALAGCGSSSSSSGGGGGGSTNVTCTAGGTTICVEPDPTNVGKFNPAALNVPTGGSVTWTFTDQGNQHTVTYDDGSYDSGPQSAGFTTTQNIAKPTGTKISYHCTLHANMLGTITVQ